MCVPGESKRGGAGTFQGTRTKQDLAQIDTLERGVKRRFSSRRWKVCRKKGDLEDSRSYRVRT